MPQPDEQPSPLENLVQRAAAALHRPGLVLLTGPPGCGRSTLLRRIAAAVPGPVHPGGGMAMLTGVPALALSRAVRARLPEHDTHLLAEAVRSRVRGGLLVLDDLQHADRVTLAALPHLAAHCRVLVALRTPHRLPATVQQALRDTATATLAVPPMDTTAATALARRVAPHLDDEAVDHVVRTAGGTPLAVTVLAAHAAAGRGDRRDDVDQVAYAVATALADLPRPARTAMAALGLLGRPAPASLLGPGAADLIRAGLVTAVSPGGFPAVGAADPASAVTGVADPASAGTGTAGAASAVTGAAGPAFAVTGAADPVPAGTDAAAPASTVADRTGPASADRALQPVSAYIADIAAGLLDAAARADLHRRIADLVDAREAARHLAAAGDHPAAYRRALEAADHSTGGNRADLLLFACALPGADVDPRVRIAAADAALLAGRPRAAARVLTTAAPLGVEADVLRGEAHLQAGEPAAARAAVQPVPDAAGAAVVAARDRVLLLADLAIDPDGAADTADKVAARYPQPPPGVAAALAAVRAAHRAPGWDVALAQAAAATSEPLIARWCAWLLVEHLAGDGRLAESGATARAAAQACSADLAYSWQTRFLAAAHWAAALHGSAAGFPAADLPAAGLPAAVDRAVHGGVPYDSDDVHRRAGDLTDRSLPLAARGYAIAATALVEADTGLLAAARARLDDTAHPATAWVSREAAWLDGQPDRAARPAPPLAGAPLLTGLHHITARWAAHDSGGPGSPVAIPAGLPIAARRTLTAWATGTGFAAAADAWRHTALREQVRCLLAAGLHDTDPARAVPALTAAEDLATRAGLTVLAGRARRALRRHHVRRDTRSPRSGSGLTDRELDVLRLVAAGEPTRRIAGQLGISAETVDTHIRAAMRKLGARTRTEAAALALPHVAEDGR